MKTSFNPNVRIMAEFDLVCLGLSRKVQTIALAKLFEHGYYGIDCKEDAPSDYLSLCLVHSQKGESKLFPVYSGGNDLT